MKSSHLYSMISLTGMVFGAEIVASHLTQSIVLLLSAYHMLYNILSLLLLVISYRMSKGKTLKNTFGWARIKVVGLFINMLFLSALCFAACVESVQTMVHASHEDTEPKYPMLLVTLGAIDLLLNILCFLLIGGYTHHQGCSMIIQRDQVKMNCVVTETEGQVSCKLRQKHDNDNKSCFSRLCGDHQVLDVTRDISSCLAVISCGCVILLLNGLILKYADAILAIASIIVLLATTYPFVIESGLILLQSIPSHIDVEGLTKRLLTEFPDLQNVHDLHVWRLTSSEIVATVHVALLTPEVYVSIKADLNEFFEKEGISSVTIQPEFTKDACLGDKSQCLLRCSPNNNCEALTCCGLFGDHHEKSGLRQRCGAHQNKNNDSSDVETSPSNVTREHEMPFLTQYDFSKFISASETNV